MTGVYYLQFSKAVDWANKRVRFLKLQAFSIDGRSLTWVCESLKGCTRHQGDQWWSNPGLGTLATSGFTALKRISCDTAGSQLFIRRQYEAGWSVGGAPDSEAIMVQTNLTMV